MDISRELSREIKLIKQQHHGLKDDAAFVLWFVREHLLDLNEFGQAIYSLTGISGDKSIDAIYIDDRYKKIHIVQGKYHSRVGVGSEGRDPVITFSSLADLPIRPQEAMDIFEDGLDLAVVQKLREGVEKITNQKYKLILYFLTSKKVSKTARNDAVKKASDLNDQANFYIYDAEWLTAKFQDYLVGAAPAIPSIKLVMSAEDLISSEGFVYRFDSSRNIASYIFTMTAKEVGKMYKDVGYRLFSRNIRGFLGPGDIRSINSAIGNTVKLSPENFWYFNNGVTIVCSAAHQDKEGNKNILTVEDPSVINGQQTTISLSSNLSEAAGVIMRVIVIPRRDGDIQEHSEFINNIVKAANRQNAIKPSDLIANDQRQVFLERLLREDGYLYLRKRRSAAEARVLFGSGLTKIDKEYLAKIIASIKYSPAEFKRTDALFDKPYYEHIFSSDEKKFYLSRFWLMENIRDAERSTEMSRANWIVLKFAWDKIGDQLEKTRIEKVFRSLCENNDKKIIKHLRSGLGAIFSASEEYFNKKTNKGKDMDIRSFFTDKIRLKNLLTHLDSKNNKYRAESRREFNSFLKKLNKLSEEAG